MRNYANIIHSLPPLLHIGYVSSLFRGLIPKIGQPLKTCYSVCAPIGHPNAQLVLPHQAADEEDKRNGGKTLHAPATSHPMLQMAVHSLQGSWRPVA